jgi:hypothetical protein
LLNRGGRAPPIFSSLNCEYYFTTDCPTYGGWSITESSTPFRHVDFKFISRLFSSKLI